MKLHPAFPTQLAFLAALACVPAATLTAAETTARVTIDAAAPGIPMAPTMHGLFFEDINFAADGGLYAELVRNRSFEDREALFAWSEVKLGEAKGSVSVATNDPVHPNNPHFIRLQADPASGSGGSEQGFGLSNTGFDGIPVRSGERYLLALHARAPGGTSVSSGIRVQLEDASGRTLATTTVSEIGTSWKRHEAVLAVRETNPNTRLVVLVAPGTTVDLDMISLFPQRTFKNRRNGLRADLAQMLADLKPGFLRFPGGCIVEGRDFANMYRWKDTVGEVWERKENENLWGTPTGPSSHYNQSYGLGFFEYFQFCEDIGAVPVPILNCGMACQARNGAAVPLDQLEPFIQDAMDLIEFANGPVTSKWGALRAKMGHPAPFNMTMLGVGNEQWEEPYFERYMIFYKALKAKHPEITLITTSGPLPDDRLWQFAWNKFKSGTPAEIVDEHYYKPPMWFLTHSDRYDSYDRKGPKIFAGEFAAHDNRRNNVRSAIAEAAYMTGLWRNAEVVTMAAYAPLFARVGHTQWEPNLIWFDGTRVYGTPSYHTQAMFARNRPDVVLPVKIDILSAAPEPPLGSRIALGTWFTDAEFDDVKVEQNGKTVYTADFEAGAKGWDLISGKWVAQGGTLRQADVGQSDLRASTELPQMAEYALSLKARRVNGLEGFLIHFDLGGEEMGRWNVGGWSNTAHALDLPGTERVMTKGVLENAKWYDVRIEVAASEVRCYLDGQLLQKAARKPLPPRKPVPALFATAGRDNATRELIVQVVNPSRNPVSATLTFAGGVALAPRAQATVLSGDPNAENSLEAPNRVAPIETAVGVTGDGLTRTFAPSSATTLRVPLAAPGKIAAKPLYRDPVFNGAADPVVVWNPRVQRWWMFYTNRRANAPGLSGVAWVHGCRIGIAESEDGATWKYLGTAEIELPEEIGGKEPTHWAPDVVTAPDGTHHMYLTVVPGVFENWNYPRRIAHLTSTDLRKWTYRSALKLVNEKVIDAAVHRLPDGTWRMWYNNERDGKSIYYADSPDLYSWTDKGKVTSINARGEGPFVFTWHGKVWMLVDTWSGLGVYRSDDFHTWTQQQDLLLAKPGQGKDDGVNGGHPGVVVSGDRVYCFYFTHPGRAGTIRPEDKESLDLRRSSIQVVELFEKDGWLTCNRDAPQYVDLKKPAN